MVAQVQDDRPTCFAGLEKLFFLSKLFIQDQFCHPELMASIIEDPVAASVVTDDADAAAYDVVGGSDVFGVVPSCFDLNYIICIHLRCPFVLSTLKHLKTCYIHNFKKSLLC